MIAKSSVQDFDRSLRMAGDPPFAEQQGRVGREQSNVAPSPPLAVPLIGTETNGLLSEEDPGNRLESINATDELASLDNVVQ